jgi:cytochrome c-type biogenesis protein CcmH/NrfF
VCENLPLAVCYTAACEDWKTQVRDLLARGYTVEEIEAYFVARFGQKTVGTPTTPVAQWLTVGLPAALIGLIGVVIAVNLWQWRRQHQINQINQISSQVARSRDAGGADAHEVEGEYHRRLEEELRDREGNR